VGPSERVAAAFSLARRLTIWFAPIFYNQELTSSAKQPTERGSSTV
jgi:hypothetical protein